jgi:error-prone DNA polymerase
MPDVEFPKLRPHPFRSAETKEIPRPAEDSAAEYAELCVTSNFTFLHGASHPEELVYTAAALGYRAVAITDLHSLAGVVRAHVAAKEYRIPLIVGARLRLTDLPGVSVFVYPTDRASYGRLCRMLTAGKRRAEKGACTLALSDLAAHADGLLTVALPDEGSPAGAEAPMQRLKSEVSRDLWLAARVGYHDHDAAWIEQVSAIAQRLALPLVDDVLYHVPERRPLQDVLTCIRHGCTIAQAGLRLQANAERHLKPRGEMQRLFRRMPDAVAQTVEIARRAAGFSLDQLRYDYPDEVVPAGTTPIRYLAELTETGAAQRYPDGVPEKVRRQIEHELALIDELNYAPYFLTVHDLVKYARSKGILCQGRGAAANSAVCFCLGVTAVDPARIDVLFERFVSRERNEPPDIDIDFEHERREEVIQYIYSKYGRERAALTAEVISYRRRSAVRDVGKALGFSLDLVDRLAKDIEWWDDGFLDAGRLRSMGLNPEDPTVRWFHRLTTELLGFPRHLSQHVGGFVISQPPLCELVPIENAAMPDRTVIEWDKDDIDALGLLKVDVLGLGMLTALRRCLDLVNARHGGDLSLATIPPEDPATYAMIQKADTVGVFQIESRAQMSMLPRLRPACFYDLVIEVAIVRPGPIQGDMVHPYLRRRQGLEQPDYAHPVIREVLHKTLGVPLFQEQCMALAVKAAGFTPGEADQLRRAMAAWKRKGNLIARFGAKLIDGMVANGIDREFAERCFRQVQGFSEYGFPESHAASFALLVYASAWLKCHHPAEFCAALLNSQPMGFYAPAQLIRDARAHGVEVRPVDVHHSDWDCTIEKDGALRLGLRMVSGLSQADGLKIRDAAARAAREGRRFASVLALWRASGAKAAAMWRLASADAFGSMGLTRQKALWQARRLRDERLPLFDPVDATRPAADAPLPPFSDSQEVRHDYAAVGLTLRRHPMSFVREALRARGVRPCGDLYDESRTEAGEWVAVAGLVLVRQRPGTARGVTFLTLEDETGIANIVVWHQTYQRYRRAAGGRVVIVHGRVQRQDNVVHVIAHRLQQLGEAASAPLRGLSVPSRDFR